MSTALLAPARERHDPATAARDWLVTCAGHLRRTRHCMAGVGVLRQTLAYHAGIRIDRQTLVLVLLDLGFRVVRSERRGGVLVADGLSCNVSRRVLDLWRMPLPGVEPIRFEWAPAKRSGSTWPIRS